MLNKIVSATIKGISEQDFIDQTEKLNKKGIVHFDDFDHTNFAVFGRKTAELANLYRKGQTSPGFGSTVDLFRVFERSVIDGKTFKEHRHALYAQYKSAFGARNEEGKWVGKDQEKLYELEAKLQTLVMRIYHEDCYPAEIAGKIMNMHAKFVNQYGPLVSFFDRSSGKFEDMDVTDDESADGEDQKIASAAGQNTTVANVIGSDKQVEAFFKCLASLYNSRSMFDRYVNGFDEDEAAMMVAFHKTIMSAVAGIAFTIESLTGYPEIMKLTIGKGQGEPLVSGKYGTCTYYIDKRLVWKRMQGEDVNPILKKTFVKQEKMEVALPDGGLTEMPVPEDMLKSFPTDDATIAKFAEKMMDEEMDKIAVGKSRNPYERGRDIELAGETIDAKPLNANNKPEDILFTQSRAETTFSKKFNKGYFSVRYSIPEEAKKEADVITETGTKASKGVGTGRIAIVRTGKEMKGDMVKLNKMAASGPVIYLGQEANPDVNDALEDSSGLLIAHANTECHGAILAKAKGVPAGVQMFSTIKITEADGKLQAMVTDMQGKTHYFNDGDLVTLAVTDDFEKPVIFEDEVPFETQKLYNSDIPHTNLKVSAIVADSGISLSTSQISDRLTSGLWMEVYGLWADKLSGELSSNISDRLDAFEKSLSEIQDDIKNLAEGDKILVLIADVKEALKDVNITAEQLFELKERAFDLTKNYVALFRTEFIYAQQLEAHPLIYHEYDQHKAFVERMLQRYGSEENIANISKESIEFFKNNIDKNRYKAFISFRSIVNSDGNVMAMDINKDDLSFVLSYIKKHGKAILKNIDYVGDNKQAAFKDIKDLINSIGVDDDYDMLLRFNNYVQSNGHNASNINTLIGRITEKRKTELAELRKEDCNTFNYEKKLVEFIETKSAGYATPLEFAKETIIQELMMMYSMYGQVEVRFYDNKPAEIKGYKGADSKIGGMPAITRVAQNEEFDPIRGSGLFLTPAFQQAWKDIELAAIKEVQERVSKLYGPGEGEKIKPFIVFSRTPEEFRQVLEMVEAAGIKGTGVMIETAENFINLFGYLLAKFPKFGSIGGNDGEATIHAIARVDRYRDIPGLSKNVSEALIASIIKTAFIYETVGLPLFSCGQNNSNNPKIAMMSAVLPFTGIGVTEDVIPEVTMSVAAMEKRLREDFGGNKEEALKAILAELFDDHIKEKARTSGISEEAAKDGIITGMLQAKREGIEEGKLILKLRDQYGIQ
ncbi:MAG: hypothetical protein A2Y40_08130 [Candidatus Margulisbacteria bacterium GWF2_35_9]|nr:MAG: hypothetical protein A2Y40_08130 [Candidatus Margulisbacteria bacterium GWF2_35_9]